MKFADRSDLRNGEYHVPSFGIDCSITFNRLVALLACFSNIFVLPIPYFEYYLVLVLMLNQHLSQIMFLLFPEEKRFPIL